MLIVVVGVLTYETFASPAPVTLYEHTNFGGRSLALNAVGDYNLESMGFANMTSSLDIQPCYVVILYQNVNKTGDFVTLTAGKVNDLTQYLGSINRSNVNDLTKYIEVKKRTDNCANETVTTTQKMGRFVRLERADGRNEYINILELEVYDGSGAKITAGVVPSLWPQYGSAGTFGPQFLIDGQANAWSDYGLVHTLANAGAYVQLDLGRDYAISQVVVRNRVNCCSDRIVGCRVVVKDVNYRDVFVYPITTNQSVYTIPVV